MNPDVSKILKEYSPFFIIIISIAVVRIVTVVIYKRRKGLKKKDNFIIGINNVTTVFAGIWLFFFALHLIGITLREFFTSITIIAAALAFIFKDYILNGLNGMILMFGDNLHIGDYIVAGEHKGVIKNMTLLNVHLKNDDEHFVTIPNNLLINTTIINYSKNSKQKIKFNFKLNTRFLPSIDELERGFIKILDNEKGKIKPNSSILEVEKLNGDMIHYCFSFGLLHYSAEEEKIIRQLLWNQVIELINGQHEKYWKKNEL